MVSVSQSWRELGVGAKVFITLVVITGTCVILYSAIYPTSRNHRTVHLLPPDRNSGCKAQGSPARNYRHDVVNFLFILLGILELGFTETMVLGTGAIMVQCFYRDRPSPIQDPFNLCASAFAIGVAYNLYHLEVTNRRTRDPPASAGPGGDYLLRGEHGIDHGRHRAH